VDPEVIAAIVSSAAVLVTAWLQARRGRGGKISDLKQDLEVYQLLPEESTSRSILLLHIDSRIQATVHESELLRRDPAGVIIAITLMVVALAFMYLTFARGGWWWASLPVSVAVAILGVYGFIQDLKKLERDDKGRRIDR